MKKLSVFVLVIINVLILSACGKSGVSDISSVQILPSKIENVSDGATVAEGCEAEEHDDSKYPLEYLGGVWVIEGLSEDTSDVSVTEETMIIETKEGKVEVESMPIQLNLLPFKDNPFEDCGVGYGELIFRKKIEEDNFFDKFCEVPVIFDTHENILALGMFSEILLNDDGVVTNEAGEKVDDIEITEFEYEIEWSGWNLSLKNEKNTFKYVPSDIDSGEGVSFYPTTYENYGGFLGTLSLNNLGNNGMIAIHEDYESLDNIIKVEPVGESTDSGNLQLYLEKAVVAKYMFEEDGTVTIETEDSGTYTYDFLYSGRSIVLMDEKNSALYSVYAEKTKASSIFTSSINNNHMSLASLYFGEQNIRLTDDSLNFWLEQGAVSEQNLEQLLAPGQMVDVTLSLHNEQFTARIINVYDTHISYYDATVARIYAEAPQGGVIWKVNSLDADLEYGISTIQDVFDYWEDIPCEKTENSLTYKAYGLIGIKSLNFEGFFQGQNSVKTEIIEDDGEREVTFLFEDGILCGFQRTAPALLYSGLQDNIAGDELTELEPSYVGDVTIVRDTILDKLKTAFATAGISVNINENTGEVVMSNSILFAVNEYELSAEGKSYIDNFMNVYASVLLSDEFADFVSGIAIEGHCDPNGTDAYNQVLSQNRADSVKKWCTESTTNNLTDTQKTKLAELATAKGYSFSDPVFDEQGNVNNDASRRVAIKFFIDINAASGTAE